MSKPSDADTERSLERYYQDFDPAHRPMPRDLPDSDVRAANALEYAAWQLGRINKKLDKLIVALEPGNK